MTNSYFNFGNGFPYQNNSFEITKSGIKRHSVKIGICILIFLSSPYIFGTLLSVLGLYEKYLNNLVLQYACDMFLTVLMLFVPFYIVYSLSENKDKKLIEKSLEKPKSPILTFSAIGFGLMLCFAGDYVSNFIYGLFQSVGITLTTTSDVEIPTSGLPLFAFAFSTIVVPAVIEEFTMRAVTMQPLRKYGDKFAILMTSLVFGLMHRNAVQGIFAFIAGAVFGYIAIATNSVWTASVVHALNNGFYVLINVLNEVNPDFADKIYMLFVSAVFVVGCVCAVLFALSRDRYRLKNSYGIMMTLGEKSSAFIFKSVPMVIAIVWMLFYTLFG